MESFFCKYQLIVSDCAFNGNKQNLHNIYVHGSHLMHTQFLGSRQRATRPIGHHVAHLLPSAVCRRPSVVHHRPSAFFASAQRLQHRPLRLSPPPANNPRPRRLPRCLVAPPTATGFRPHPPSQTSIAGGVTGARHRCHPKNPNPNST
jgi:hypothetical protein